MAASRSGAPAKVAFVPVRFTVMLPAAGKANALRFVSAASTNVEPVPPLRVCVPPIWVVPRRFTVPAGVKVASPATVRVCPRGRVMSPAVVVAVRLPPTVEVASVSAPPLVRLTEPRTGAAVVLKLALPATASAPDWLISPPAVTLNVPLTVEAARSSAFASVKATLLPLVIPTVVKLLPALLSVMLFPAPAASVVVPATVSAPLCVRAPVVVTLRVPDTVEAARFSAVASVRATLLALVIPTVLKSLAAFVRVMLFPAPAASVVVPAAVTAPVCVMGPVAVIVSAPVEVAPALALTLPIVTAFACCQAMSPPVKVTVLNTFPALGSVMLPRVPAVPPGSVVQGLGPANLSRAQEIHIPSRRQGRIARHGERLSQGQGNIPRRGGGGEITAHRRSRQRQGAAIGEAH